MTSSELHDIFIAGIIVGLALGTLIWMLTITIHNARQRHHRRQHYLTTRTLRPTILQ